MSVNCSRNSCARVVPSLLTKVHDTGTRTGDECFGPTRPARGRKTFRALSILEISELDCVKRISINGRERGEPASTCLGEGMWFAAFECFYLRKRSTKLWLLHTLLTLFPSDRAGGLFFNLFYLFPSRLFRCRSRCSWTLSWLSKRW